MYSSALQITILDTTIKGNIFVTHFSAKTLKLYFQVSKLLEMKLCF